MSIRVFPDHIAAHNTYIRLQQATDEFLRACGYTKFEVPTLSSTLIPESYLEVFGTQFRYGDSRTDLFLVPSPELYLKRLIAAGAGSCYSLMHCFRNAEPHTSRHSPEFMMLELYKVNADYFDVAKDVFTLFRKLAETARGSSTFTYRGQTISLDNWEQLTVSEAFSRYASMNDILDEESFMNQAKRKGYVVDGFSYADVWSQIYVQEVEPHLGTNGKLTILYEYPRQLAATAEYDAERNVAYRLEMYLAGVELGNCGNASTQDMDFKELHKRFEAEQAVRTRQQMVHHTPDYEFIEILKAMPKTAGIAVGFERLAMILADVESLQDIHVVSYD